MRFSETWNGVGVSSARAQSHLPIVDRPVHAARLPVESESDMAADHLAAGDRWKQPRRRDQDGREAEGGQAEVGSLQCSRCCVRGCWAVGTPAGRRWSPPPAARLEVPPLKFLARSLLLQQPAREGQRTAQLTAPHLIPRQPHRGVDPATGVCACSLFARVS